VAVVVDTSMAVAVAVVVLITVLLALVDWLTLRPAAAAVAAHIVQVEIVGNQVEPVPGQHTAAQVAQVVIPVVVEKDWQVMIHRQVVAGAVEIKGHQISPPYFWVLAAALVVDMTMQTEMEEVEVVGRVL